MHTYHISYAAFSANKYSANNDYIRLRRYLPSRKSLNGTNATNGYEKTELFKPNHTYHIQVFKYNNQVIMHIQNTSVSTEQLTCEWDVSKFPDCNEGRVGFRHMYTRSARYKNIKVWKLK